VTSPIASTALRVIFMSVSYADAREAALRPLTSPRG
jgi:hypothetical protein